MKRTILCLNLGYEGGCVYYANRIIESLDLPKLVWLSKYSEEPFQGSHTKINVNRGLKSLIWRSVFILPVYLLRIIWNLSLNKFSNVIVFGPHTWDFVFLYIFRIFNRRAYYVVHDGIMHVGENSIIHQWMLTRSIKNASHLIFLSENVKNNVSEKLHITKPCIIIPHGIINFSDAHNDFVDKRTMRDKPKLLMIGRINYYKGINLLIDMFSFFDFSLIDELIIAGSIDNKNNESLLMGFPKVRVINKWLSTAEFDQLVHDCDFLLMPYLEASQSGIAAVSIGYQKPAIVSRVGAMEEQFNSVSAYFFDTLAPQSFYNKIIEAISNKDEYYRIQRELLILANSLTWHSLSDKLKNYINENCDTSVK